MRGRSLKGADGTHLPRSAHVRGLAVVVCSLLAMLLLTGTASAKIVESNGSFTCNVTEPEPPEPQLPPVCGSSTSWTPTYVAVNEQTGNVYVIDSANDAIDVFDENGKYLSQILGSSTERKSFSFGGGFEDIAVDNSGGPNDGRIYVTSNAANLVFAFDSSGNFLWQSNAEGFLSFAGGVAVDPSGNPWVTDVLSGIQELNPEKGQPAGKPIKKESEPDQLAFDSVSDMAVLEGFGAVHVFAPDGTELHAYGTGFTLTDVAIDTVASSFWSNAVFTVDANGVHIWDSSGQVVNETPFGPAGTGMSISINSRVGKVYLTEPKEGRIDVYTLIPRYALDVSTTGNGTGAVTCGGSACQETYGNTEKVKLEATPAEGSVFVGWKVNGSSSACPGAGACEIALGSDTAVEAEFALEERSLTVSKTGEGQVQSNPAGIACGATCSASFSKEQFVVLSAVPAAHNHLVGWTGCDAVNSAGACEVTLGADRSVSVQFAPTMRKLAVSDAGTGSGAVTCQVGVGAQEPCSDEYQDGTVLTLSANAASGSTFAGFSGGGCSATVSCVLTLAADTSVVATFNLVPVDKITEKPAEKPAEKPVEAIKTEKLGEKGSVKKRSLSRGQMLARAIRQCHRLPKHKQAACIRKAKKKYAPPKHKNHKNKK